MNNSTMKIYAMVMVSLALATPAVAQLNMKLALGINSTSINNGEKDSYYVSEFPKEINLTAGLEAEYSLRGQSLMPGHASFVSGFFYLKNGYSDNYFFEFSGSQLGYESNFKSSYVQIPLLIRYNFRPLPLVENFTLFFGGGVSNNILLKAELKESYTDNPCFGCGIDTYSDEGDVTEYGRKVSFFGDVEAGFEFKRTQVMLRHKRSLQDMYFKDLASNWGVPPESSHYTLLHNQTGKLREIHWELMLSYRLF